MSEPPSKLSGRSGKMEHNSKGYRRSIGDSSDFNRKLFADRRQRMPYVDPQTGIAQSDCLLWRNETDRLQPAFGNQAPCAPRARVFCYPAPRWQKRRREYLIKSEYPSMNATYKQDTSAPQPCHSTPKASNPLTTSTMSVPSGSHLGLIDQLGPNLGPMSYNNSGLKSSVSQQNHLNGPFHLSLPQPAQPPRSSSVGSYSCIDSDSRDQSSATSQSVDSPHHNHIEEDQMYHNHGHQYGTILEHSSGVDPAYCKDVNGFGKLNDGRKPDNYNDTLTYRAQCGDEKSSAENEVQSRIKMVPKANRNSPNKSQRQTNGLLNGTNKSKKQRKEKVELVTDDDQPKASIVGGSRPYICTICDQSYKTRPGLSYHFIHVHDTTLPKKLPNKRQMGCQLSVEPSTRSKGERVRQKEKRNKRRETTNGLALRASRRIRGAKAEGVDCFEVSKSDDPRLEANKAESYPEVAAEKAHEESIIEPVRDESLGLADEQVENDIGEESRAESDKTVIEGPSDQVVSKISTTASSMSSGISSDKLNDLESNTNDSKTGAKQNIFCDFCLGTVERNRRTRLPEELISCSSCGSSGHPSCLQFSDESLLSVKKYKWQCIDCKTCTYCNKADNEAQLLICNDCDRSYHTYCLKPPLSELPEESWSCSICLAESD